MCLGLLGKVNSAAWRVPQLSKRSMVAASSFRATPWPQKSGRTVSGPKKPKLPQFAAKLEPTSAPSA